MASAGAVETASAASSATRAASVECRHVEKWFGELNVLADVDFAISAGSFVSVLGPSGCGKTTLMRAIGGLTGVDTGEILVAGHRVAGPPREAAIVFQQFGLMPWKTIYDNVAFGLTVRGVDKRDLDDRVRHYIDLVHLTGFERSFPYQVSGGMQQRAGLARALAV